MLAALAFSGALAAFATIPPAEDAGLARMRTALPEALALAPETLAAPERYVREERFRSDDTLAALLARLGIAESDARQLARLKELRLLRPGALVAAHTGPDGALQRLEFLAPRDMRVVAGREGARLIAFEERAPIQTRAALGTGSIRSSLFAAADEAAIPDAVAIQLAEVFGGDIDFHRDLRQGDRFSVVYEAHVLDGRTVRTGRVLAAEFVNQGRAYRAAGFGGQYYAPDGRNLRKAFLRSPLEFSRVSSGFGLRRHPFLRTWRAHRGVDYAAPAGTRVRTVADGTVEFAGRNAGYGNVVVVRHQGSYSTVYAHLKGFARGLRPGSRLAQGDTVGYVGQTGWATGPHLHYELRVAGEARDPFKVALPSGLPIAAHEAAAYREHAAPLLARLDLLAGSQLALLE
jgi:murein DD-endopeptidase MepM/ murein hydrolase activator NlpD